jgi:5-methylcytosine-specific restriction protein B
VFGELITLLEDDKRLGCDNEIIVRLPYSGTLFGVPPNLHVIGTMNTADRSIEALDSALRRRFEFEELPPRPELLDFTIDGPIDPRRMLQAINQRLAKLRDRDHGIGHAYLLQLADNPTIDALKRVFASKLLPLLQEYFFGDWGKIGLVLGKDFVRRKSDGIELADFDHEDRDALSERPVYELTPISELTDQAFRRIYEDVPTDA